jgi:hypothetical protein
MAGFLERARYGAISALFNQRPIVFGIETGLGEWSHVESGRPFRIGIAGTALHLK